MGRSEKRKKERVGATVQLYVGDDDDLIRWLNSLPEKGKNQALKTVLRLGLELPIPEPKQTEMEAVRSQLESLQDAIAHMPDIIAQQPTNGAAADNSAIEDMQRQLFEMGQQLDQWRHWLDRDLPGYVAGIAASVAGGQPPAEQPALIEDAPRLSKKEQAVRKAKLGKSEW